MPEKRVQNCLPLRCPSPTLSSPSHISLSLLIAPSFFPRIVTLQVWHWPSPPHFSNHPFLTSLEHCHPFHKPHLLPYLFSTPFAHIYLHYVISCFLSCSSQKIDNSCQCVLCFRVPHWYSLRCLRAAWIRGYTCLGCRKLVLHVHYGSTAWTREIGSICILWSSGNWFSQILSSTWPNIAGQTKQSALAQRERLELKEVDWGCVGWGFPFATVD